MRALVWAALALGAEACKYPELPPLTGDAQPGDTDARPLDDAAVDVPHICFIPTNLGGGTFGMPGQPVDSNWFTTPTSGPLAGRTVFTIPAQLTQDAPINVLQIDVAKPAGGFAVNIPYAFATTPGATVVAQAMLYGNYDLAMGTFEQELYASGGSITFREISEAPFGNITGAVTMTAYREIDQVTYADVPNGCTSTMMSIEFYLRQML